MQRVQSLLEKDALPRALWSSMSRTPLLHRAGEGAAGAWATTAVPAAAPYVDGAVASVEPTFGVLATIGDCGSRLGSLLPVGDALNDVIVAAVTTAAALMWLRIWTTLAQKGMVDPKVSRKIIHCGSAPLFLMLWPLFSSSGSARLLAAAVPLYQVFKLLKAGIAGTRSEATGEKLGSGDESLVKAISRTGKAQEALQGPLIYTLVLSAATLLHWRSSPVGLLAVTQMAAGDGLADIVGRRFGAGNKWPMVPSKSVAGSAAFVLGGFTVSGLMLWWFTATGCIALPDSGTNGPLGCAAKLLLISLASAAVELVPVADDNVTVPVAAALMAAILFSV